MIQGKGSTIAAALIFDPILAGAGGAFSALASTIAIQASVSHEYVALATSLLNLWTSIRGAIRDTIAGVIWNSKITILVSNNIYWSFNAFTDTKDPTALDALSMLLFNRYIESYIGILFLLMI